MKLKPTIPLPHKKHPNKYWTATAILLLIHLTTTAQSTYSNLRQTKPINTTSTILVTDSLTIITASVQCRDSASNQIIPKIYYRLANNQIIRNGIFNTKTVYFTYRVLPYNLGYVHKRLDSTQIKRSPSGLPIDYDYSPYDQANDNSGNIFENKTLDYNGSFTRGISVGNAQSLVLNSAFNLNLSGKIGEDMEILAAITDNNIPLQAEGNTRQLKEFDKIFIQVKKKNNTLLAGDYELSSPKNYFLNYYKKVQGGTYTYLSDTTQTGTSYKGKVSLALAKGKFSRYTVPVVEGNQGPYRLVGYEGTNFIIILAGTEKVYLNGQLMQRGEDADYIMDYNRGDISFTPRRLINAQSRLVVEFEYSDQSYLRTVYALSTEYQTKRLRLHLNLYSEQDSKNSPGTQTLDSLDKVVLRNSGANPDNAILPSVLIPADGFRIDRIQYKQIDTLVNGIRYLALVYSTNPDSAIYLASFAPVGEGKGHYIQSPSSANGRVYAWIAPSADGQLRGNFEPVRKLVPPTQQQLYTLGLDYQLSKKGKFKTELALSRLNANLFSTQGDSAGTGIAINNQYAETWSFGGQKKDNWIAQTDIKHEWVQKGFKPINPYRPTEFTRDWNTPNQIGGLTPQFQEQLLDANLGIGRRDWGKINYSYGSFSRQAAYQGNKQGIDIGFHHYGIDLESSMSLLTTNSTNEQTTFFRPKLDISYLIPFVRIGLSASRERNQRYYNTGLSSLITDTLSKASFFFDVLKAYIELPEDKKITSALSFTRRWDYSPNNTIFSQSSQSEEINLTGKLNITPSKNQQPITNRNSTLTSRLLWNLTYRNLSITDTLLTYQKPQQTYLGRIEYNIGAYKNAIFANTLYEIGSGQEQKLEYQYIKVQTGQGQYIWRNRHAGDTIPRLDEFEISPYPDQANYVRVVLTTSQFIRTNNVQFSQTLRLDPRLLWQTNKGAKGLLSRFSTSHAWLINRKVKAGDEGVSQWNPFQTDIPDASLVTITQSIRNSLQFNRGNEIYDLELGQLDNRSRVVLSTGYEDRQKSEYFLKNRWNIDPHLNLLTVLSHGTQANLTEAFLSRNYQIQYNKIEPQLNWTPNNDFRITTAYKYRTGENTLKANGEQLNLHDLSIETTYNKTASTQIRLKINAITLDYTGADNTPVSFALLEGLQNGKNYLWNIGLERALQKNMQLTFNYEGRKTGELGIVHVGRVQIRANF
jgi:hypothetical protein